MSYDISMVIDTGGPLDVVVEDVGNYTYNVSPMFSLALGHGLSELDDMLGRDALPRLTAAVADMASDPNDYRALNPANGWGDYEGALTYLRKLRDACERHPKAKISIC